ncbi:MAG: DUF4382 domain-containing protein [Longimicrobiales bacterium]
MRRKRDSFRRDYTWLIALLVASLPLGACDQSTDLEISDGRGKVAVYLKDAPGDVDSVWVQVDRIVLKGGDGDVVLLDEPTPLLNLIALRDSAVALAEGVEVDQGDYEQLRIIIGGAVLQTRSGAVYTQGGAEHPGGMEATGELVCPSCSQSGLKVKLAGDLEIDEEENAILLDFDVSQSFGHQAGNSGKWIMRPVIHAVKADVDDIEDDDVGGRIAGTVALGMGADSVPVAIPACGGQQQTLLDFLPLATATTLVDDEGNALVFAGAVEIKEGEPTVFEIRTTAFDIYALGYRGATEYTSEKLVWTATVSPAQVTLSEAADQVGNVTFTITGVTCQGLTP